jgi:LmbE family N-acetylglucosaminyl deacetylase
MQPRNHHPRLPAADVSHLGTILQIWAHPDDESYLAGGLSIRAADNGQHVVCITATHGEAGGDPSLAPTVVAAQRDRELAAALAVLGIGEHVQFDYPDGGCADSDSFEATRRLADCIERVQPDTIVTFGPDGVTGHADHRAVSRWATNAWIASDCRAQLLYASTLHSFATRFRDIHEELNAFEPGYPVSTPRRELSVLLSLDDATLLRKRDALRAHNSQTAAVESMMGEAMYLSWWQEECFRRAGFAGNRLRSIERPRQTIRSGSTSLQHM